MLELRVLHFGAQAIARRAVRCASQVLYRGAQAVTRSAARCVSQVLGCGEFELELVHTQME
jgi:hypothetical protein